MLKLLTKRVFASSLIDCELSVFSIAQSFPFNFEGLNQIVCLFKANLHWLKFNTGSIFHSSFGILLGVFEFWVFSIEDGYREKQLETFVRKRSIKCHSWHSLFFMHTRCVTKYMPKPWCHSSFLEMILFYKNVCTHMCCTTLTGGESASILQNHNAKTKVSYTQLPITLLQYPHSKHLVWLQYALYIISDLTT